MENVKAGPSLVYNPNRESKKPDNSGLGTQEKI